MLLKALDLLRVIGWGVISFIFSLIDSLFEIIKEINSFDIINSMAQNDIFRNLHTSIIIIAITLFGLFTVWSFVRKIIDPDDGLAFGQIVKETIKCGAFIMLSTFLFSQIASFSIQLSGFTANIFKNNNTELSDSMLTLYVDYSDSYKITENKELDKTIIEENIKNNKFTNAKMYNDKFVTNDRFILPNEKDYKYTINWIMAIIIGGFFLYALFFSGMMLARRQIEYLFLFIISPIVFATSIGNRQRRGAVIEQLVSLTLQSVVVMLIINITALIMGAVNNTVFFTNDFHNTVIKSLMFIGCGSFLLTGSQVINRFIGGNVSANSGREQMMSLMGFGQTLSSIGSVGGLATTGAGMMGTGALIKGIGLLSNNGTKTMACIGDKIASFGNKIATSASDNKPIESIGSKISNFGTNVQTKANNVLQSKNKEGLSIPNIPNKLNRFGGRMMDSGMDSLESAFNSIIPTHNLYRRRSRYKD